MDDHFVWKLWKTVSKKYEIDNENGRNILRQFNENTKSSRRLVGSAIATSAVSIVLKVSKYDPYMLSIAQRLQDGNLEESIFVNGILVKVEKMLLFR